MTQYDIYTLFYTIPNGIIHFNIGAPLSGTPVKLRLTTLKA